METLSVQTSDELLTTDSRLLTTNHGIEPALRLA
jgi:hypothetical protein